MAEDNHLDPAVLAALPPGGKVLSVFQHGRTNWSTGYKIEYEVDNEEKEYFLKVLDRARADEMARGEFESSKALIQHIPETIVPPIAWGKYEEDQSKAFYLTHFRYLHEQLPTNSQLLSIIKKLHQSSASPTGKFGFHVTTFWGPPPMDNTWTDSWEEYYTRKFRSALEYGQIPHGRDEELCELGEEFIRKVIPRLLRPLQTGGRSIKPTLCHGDLYDANIQIDSATNQPVLFDPCCFYGHHEMEFQCMRAARNAVGPAFVNAYKNEVGASEPQQDFDDRNTLYSIRCDLETVGMWPQWLGSVKDEMRRLLAKHPDGIDGFKEEHHVAAEAEVVHPKSRPELGVGARDIAPIPVYQAVGLEA
ncbi:Fructosamine kinase-domain-containing protein [Coniochaeta sp. 2T2.1]|nr:Fructosamine kinase-domain-containing protein [Coniochaeta sp. 2T2.1]